MLYAKVVVGLPLEGPFDYSVPQELTKKIKVGMRVRVSFGARKIIGYVVGLSRHSTIKNLKPISELIDAAVILEKGLLLLTKELSDYYSCSWGEAIETALPQALRKGKRIPFISHNKDIAPGGMPEVILVHDLSGGSRWEIYLKAIKEALDNHKSVIILLPDMPSLLQAKERIISLFGIMPVLLYRKEPQEIEEWLKIKRQETKIVLGTRAAIFAPLEDLGLVIIDEEDNFVYKQDQVPHYHAREVARMRIDIQKARLILGATAPSLESFYAARLAEFKYILLPRIKNFPEIKIIDTLQPHRKERDLLSRYTTDAILSTLNAGGKALLFLNRKGFATFAYCHNCGTLLKCPRCNINLVYHFKDNLLDCHYCNFKMAPPNICPACDSGYIKYSGTGTEKIESELARIFPQAKIKIWDAAERLNLKDTDIVVSSQNILKETDLNFDLIAVISVDNALNRIDFRASEKTFALLAGLWGLTDKKMIIQTRLINHHCFRALQQRETDIFYDEELRHRRQLGFPPYQHLGLIKLRGKNEARVREMALRLFEKISAENKFKQVKVVSVNPAHPAKLRGNFYWQIFLKSRTPKKMSNFVKINLKKFPHSGIIVTADIDPL